MIIHGKTIKLLFVFLGEAKCCEILCSFNLGTLEVSPFPKLPFFPGNVGQCCMVLSAVVIVVCNFPILVTNARSFPIAFHVGSNWPKVAAGFSVDALGFIRQVGHSRGMSLPFQCPVLVLRPFFAPLGQKFGAVPVALLFAESVVRQLPHCEHHMRMVVTVVAFV